jgi:hypothetical protein
VTTEAKLSPGDILIEHPPRIRKLAGRVRAIVEDAIPAREERAYARGHAIGLLHPEAGNFCTIFPADEKIEVVFEHGRTLSDPQGILSGEYTQIRTLILNDLKQLEEVQTALEALLLESIDMGISLRGKKHRK